MIMRIQLLYCMLAVLGLFAAHLVAAFVADLEILQASERAYMAVFGSCFGLSWMILMLNAGIIEVPIRECLVFLVVFLIGSLLVQTPSAFATIIVLLSAVFCMQATRWVSSAKERDR